MNKQPISVTLSPDNLVWLRGRARAAALGSLSEYLDRLITRARFGQDTPRAARSMKGALAGIADEAADRTAAIPPEAWHAWQSTWDDLLAGVDVTRPMAVHAHATRHAPAPRAAAKGTPVAARRSRRA